VVGGIAAKLAPDRRTHDAARAIAADHVAGLDRLGLSLVWRLKPLERDRHPLCPTVAAARRRLNGNDAPRIMRLEFRGRSAHDFQIEIMHARLVENDVRKLRQAIFDVLDPAAADDVRGLPVIRLPERRLIDPAGLLQHALAEAEGMEHLRRAAGDAVSLAELHPARLLLDDAGLDIGKRGQLRRKRQPCRSAAEDQDIDLFGNSTLRTRGRISLRPVEDLRVARLESIQVKLHDHSLSSTAGAARAIFLAAARPLIGSSTTSFAGSGA